MKSIKVLSPFTITPKIANNFCAKASIFDSEIYIEKDEKRVNAKNILGILSILIVKGDNFHLITDGKDEEQALESLASFFVENKNKKERK